MTTEDDVNAIGDRLAGVGHNNPPAPTLDERFAQIVDDVETMAAKGQKLPVEIKDSEKLGELVEVVKTAKKLNTRIDDMRKAENRPLDETIKSNNSWFSAHTSRLKRMTDVLEQRAGVYNQRLRDEEQARLREEARKREEIERAERERQERERQEQGEKDGIDAEMERDRLERLENERRDAEARAMRSSGPTRTSAGTVGSTKKLDFRVPNYSLIDLNEFRDSFTVEMIDKAIRDHVRRHKKTKPLKGVEIFESTTTNIR